MAAPVIRIDAIRYAKHERTAVTFQNVGFFAGTRLCAS